MASTRKHPWTTLENDAIAELVDLHGENSWKAICAELKRRQLGPVRSCKQCREHWFNNLSPNVKKGDWSDEEKAKLFKSHQQFGNKWSKIAECLPGRTDNAIKNFFYGTIRKALKAYNKQHKDDNRILRTLKSLIRDKDVTKILGLDQDEAQTAPDDQTHEIVVPQAVWTESAYQQWWCHMQWYLALNYYYSDV